MYCTLMLDTLLVLWNSYPNSIIWWGGCSVEIHILNTNFHVF
jgi:hypothetical protein